MGALCTGSSGGTQTSVSRSSLPSWISEAGQENFEIARDISATPYQPYPAPRIAGFTPDQESAFSLTRENAGAWKPLMGQATGMAEHAARGATSGFDARSWLDADHAGYMSPYTDRVIERTMARIREMGDVNQRDIGMRATAAGAFGGSRHGVVEGLNRKATVDAMADSSAQLYDQSYREGRTGFEADEARRFAAWQGNQQQVDRMRAAAQLLAELGFQQQGMKLRDAGALETVGGQQQALNQRNHDLAYQDFLRQLGYPAEQLNLRTAALTGAPYGRSDATTSPYQPPNTTAQGLGAGAAFLAALNNV